MELFYKITSREINTEKSQKGLEVNQRTFISLPSVKKKDILSAFVKSFGYKPDKINSLTFMKVINNRKNRTARRVKMKKFFITLPDGKKLTPIKN
ncbi:MAG: ribosomal protein L23 [Candidatus Deianiraeaceae bacterium]|jgi:ribosomal protein L23